MWATLLQKSIPLAAVHEERRFDAQLGKFSSLDDVKNTRAKAWTFEPPTVDPLASQC